MKGTGKGLTMGEGRIVRRETGEIFKASGSNTDGRFELFVLDVEYLFGPPLHIHDVQEDSFYVVDGALTVQIGDEVTELKPGDFATAPPGVAHTFTNVEPEKVVRLVNIMTPGIGFDRYVAAAMSGADQIEMERLGREYGVTIVGPPLPATLGLN